MDAFNAMENPAADPFGGFLTSLGGGAPQGTLQDALNAPAPQVNMPQRGQADTSKVAPLAMLALAASIAQRRQQGQSRTSQILDGALRAAQVAGSLKQEAEGQVDRRYQQDVAAMKTQQELQSGAIRLETAQRENTMSKVTAPMQLESLRMKMAESRSKAEADAIDLRLKKLREGVAKELLDNEVAMGKAKTDSERASIGQKADEARAKLKQADAAMVEAQAKKEEWRIKGEAIQNEKRQAKVTIGTALPGQPVPLTGVDADGTSWTSMQPMGRTEAELYLRDQYRQLDKAGAKLGPVEEYVKNNIDSYLNPQKRIMSGKGAGAPAAPGAAPAAGTPPPAAPTVHPAQAASQGKPDQIIRGKDKTYWIGGKQVDEATAAERGNMTVEQLRGGNAKPVNAPPQNIEQGTKPGMASPTPQVTQMSAIARQAEMEMAEVAARKRSQMGLSWNVVQYLREKALAEQAAAQGNPR